MTEKSIYTVGQLNGELKNLVESSFRSIWVEGEISGLARPSSGHLYFSLKEDNSLIRCAFFRNRQHKSGMIPGHGMQVLLQGQISYYEPRGDLQLIVSYMEEAGEGALRRAFEVLKKKLLDEGLFDPENKLEIPHLPVTIGVITSESGAVFQDILTTLRRRSPSIRVILYPTQVQGNDAPANITQALKIANERSECDVLIVARGGGSLDDLQAFNTEIVARALFDSDIPIVSAVGHETDFTISDFVADCRAPTPTAAAEMLSPDSAQLRSQFQNLQVRLKNLLDGQIRHSRQTVDYLSNRLVHPQQKLAIYIKDKEYLRRQLVSVAKQNINNVRYRTDGLRSRIIFRSPLRMLDSAKDQLFSLQREIVRIPNQRIEVLNARITTLRGSTSILGPQSTLNRGYAIAQDKNKTIITDHTGLNNGDAINITVSTGKFKASVVVSGENKP